jgi:hypothetical protein
MIFLLHSGGRRASLVAELALTPSVSENSSWLSRPNVPAHEAPSDGAPQAPAQGRLRLRRSDTMKFYRMDSDQPDWKVWRDIFREVGHRDFHFAKSLFHDLYSYIAEAIDTDKPPTAATVFVVSHKDLIESTHSTDERVVRMMGVLARHFEFTAMLVENPVEKPVHKGSGQLPLWHDRATAAPQPSSRSWHVSYPNLVKKQKRAWRKSGEKVAKQAGDSRLSTRTRNADVTRNALDSSADDIPPPTDADRPGAHVSPAVFWNDAEDRSLVCHLVVLQATFGRDPKGGAPIDQWAEELRQLRGRVGASHELVREVLSWAFKQPRWQTALDTPADLSASWDLILRLMRAADPNARRHH